MTEKTHPDHTSAMWSVPVPRRYRPMIRRLREEDCEQRTRLLAARWTAIEGKLKELLEFGNRMPPSLKRGFEEFCAKTAAEKARSDLRLLLTTDAIALVSAGVVLALGVVLFTAAGGAVEIRDWVVTAAGLVMMKVLDRTLARGRSALTALICAALALISAWPVLAVDPRAAADVELFLHRLADEGNGLAGLALGVFLTAAGATVILFLRGVLRAGMSRAERLRHRNVVPDVKAFEQFHQIVADLLDADMLLAGMARVRLAERLVEAADWLEDMANLYTGLDGLREQRRALRRRLRSVATHLREDNKILASSPDGDVDILADCLTCLVAISAGRIGDLPEAFRDQQKAATRARWISSVQTRAFPAVGLALLVVLGNASFDWGGGTVVAFIVLIILLVVVAPEQWLQRAASFGFWSRAGRWFGSAAGERASLDRDPRSPDDEVEGDQR